MLNVFFFFCLSKFQGIVNGFNFYCHFIFIGLGFFRIWWLCLCLWWFLSDIYRKSIFWIQETDNSNRAPILCQIAFSSLAFPFLYARLQTGRIMVWWCPSVRPGLRPSVRPSITVFRTFLLHALTYWSEILCITLFLCT